MSQAIMFLYESQPEIRKPIGRIGRVGFSMNDDAMMFDQRARPVQHFGIFESDKAEEGLVFGIIIGGIIGALYMALAAVAAFFIPSLHSFVPDLCTGCSL